MTATTLIGRSPELSQLMDLVTGTVMLRKNNVVLVSGEAGVGKTRLLNDFIHEATSEYGPDALLSGYGQAVTTSVETDAFQVVRECLRSLTAAVAAAQSPALRRRVVEAFRHHAPDWLRSVPLVGNLLEAGLRTARTARNRIL